MNAVHDHIEMSTLLGLRFADAATGELLRSDLHVEVYLASRPQRRARAFLVGSGCWAPVDLAAALGLPDLGEAERAGIGSAAWVRLMQRALRLRVEVTDVARRFLPSRHEVLLPTAVAAPAALLEDSLPAPLPLYSAPWRRPGADLLTLRAELLDRASGAPLAGAWASVEPAGAVPANPQVLASGIADAKGHLLLAVRQPTRAAAPPPGGGAGASRALPLRLTVRHRALPPGADPAWTDVAERASQAALPARLGVATAALTAADDVPLAAIALMRGVPQVLRTTRLVAGAQGQPSSTALPSLLVAAP